MSRARRKGQTPPRWRGSSLGEGPRLVLFHGGPGLDHRVLLPLAEQLARTFEVWVPDLPGHGDGPLLDPGSATLHRAMARIAALDGGADLVVGHSLGAWLLQDALKEGLLAPRLGVVVAATAPSLRRTMRMWFPISRMGASWYASTASVSPAGSMMAMSARSPTVRVPASIPNQLACSPVSARPPAARS